ncbi:MAG TPA: response regulator [Usitatibacter sp.]|nr:response regulator [Usitatibacter sp.]
MSATATPPPGRGSDRSHRRSAALLPPATFAGLVVAALAALVIAYVSAESSRSRADTSRQLTQTLEVIGQIEATVSLLKGAESGQRGYMLTGDEGYLEPFRVARARYAADLPRLRDMVSGDPAQQRRVDQLAEAAVAKFAELDETISLKRAGKTDEALAIVRSDRGKLIMDRIRGIADELDRDERARFESRRLTWENESRTTIYIGWGGAAILFFLIGAAGWMASRDYRQRSRTAWIRTGESLLSARIQGEQRLEKLGDEVLAFLADYLDAKVGAAYAHGDDGLYRRIAGYALDASTLGSVVRPGESLLGQAAKDGHPLRVTDVPEGYLPLASAVGRGSPRELLIAPAIVDGEVQGVVELGLLRRVDDADRELLDGIAEMLAVAIRSARERGRREELLEETQRQAEALQSQGEELRVSNEELEEQGRALRESQARLEDQHSELEATNTQLEEQTQRLERQKRELMHAQEALAKNAEMLERTNRYKSEFLANMSHELRTPLNSSLILAKLLADNVRGNLDEEQVRFARTIHASNNDLLTLINDILDLSKIEAGQVEVAAEPVNVEEVLAQMRAMFDPVAAHKKVDLRIERAVNAPATITTDRQRLQQVLRNLLSNALKFTDGGEVVMQVAQARDARVAFSVRDTGIGIAPEQHEVIFEAFRQADGTTSRKYGGTGLGLSISRELARLLGGQIRLESKPGSGSIFTLEIPTHFSKAPSRTEVAATRPPPAAAAPKPSSAPRAPAPRLDDDRNKRSHPERLILVVEDDLHFARVLYDLAHELEFDCVHTSSGAEALELARRLQPSGILLDVNLPEDSGLTILERIKRDPTVRHIPVHMVSVEDHAQAAMGMGAVGYALKPVAREDLVKAIRRLEAQLQKRVSKVLVVEDDATLRDNIALLLAADSVEITTVGTVKEAKEKVRDEAFDCLVTDLQLPDASGYDLLESLAAEGRHATLPVIVYTGRALTREEEVRLRRYSKSIIIKGARSPERLLDEVTLFLHRVEANLPEDKRDLLRRVRQRDDVFEGRKILLAEDDVRNIFALSRVLEPLGAQVEIARNGQEAVDRAAKGDIDLILMDIMMPVKDGLTAIREIRARPDIEKLPIIAITAKAMAEDRRQCLDAGANDYIAKPIDIDQLVSLCRVWMPK